MNTIPKIVLSAIFAAIAVPFPAKANDLPSFPFLLVQGEAKTEVRPDKATLSVYVSAFDPQSEIAVETVQKQLVRLLGTLKKYSIPDEAITSFNLVKEVERDRKDRVEMEIVGYHVSRRLKVDLLDISQFAELIADIARLDNVSSLNAEFDVTNRDAIEVRLMNEAGADARRSAENLVQGMSRQVGSVYAISESSFRSSIARFAIAEGESYTLAMARNDMAYSETIFEPTTIELRQSVHVLFQLE
jgi:uncharacterized protein YggE